MIAIHLHFFRQLRASGVLSVVPKTRWWRQNDVQEKSAQCGNQLVKQELVVVSPKKSPYKTDIKSTQNFYCGSCSFNLLQAHENFSLWRRVPLTFAFAVPQGRQKEGQRCRNLPSEHHGSPASQEGHSHPVPHRTAHMRRMLSCVSERPGQWESLWHDAVRMAVASDCSWQGAQHSSLQPSNTTSAILLSPSLAPYKLFSKKNKITNFQDL